MVWTRRAARLVKVRCAGLGERVHRGGNRRVLGISAEAVRIAQHRRWRECASCSPASPASGAVSRFGPHRQRIRRQRHGERVQQERDRACSTRTATPAPPSRRRREGGARHRTSPGPGGRSDRAGWPPRTRPVHRRLRTADPRRARSRPPPRRRRRARAPSARAPTTRTPPATVRIVMMAISDSRCSIDEEDRSVESSADSRRPASGAVTSALNGGQAAVSGQARSPSMRCVPQS